MRIEQLIEIKEDLYDLLKRQKEDLIKAKKIGKKEHLILAYRALKITYAKLEKNQKELNKIDIKIKKAYDGKYHIRYDNAMIACNIDDFNRCLPLRISKGHGVSIGYPDDIVWNHEEIAYPKLVTQIAYVDDGDDYFITNSSIKYTCF